jgi:hypothetical protein
MVLTRLYADDTAHNPTLTGRNVESERLKGSGKPMLYLKRQSPILSTHYCNIDREDEEEKRP